MRALAVFLISFLLFAVPVSAFEIENAAKMPYLLDAAFIKEIWLEVVRATNDKAPIFKIEPAFMISKIIYIEKQLPPLRGKVPVMATIVFFEDPKTPGWVDMDKPRTINIYPAAFQEYFPEYLPIPPKFFPEQAYGIIAQELFHEALFRQRVTPDYHHCAMIFRGTLEKVLRFIDLRLGTGSRVTRSIIDYTKGQCEMDSGGRMRFPSSPSRS